MSSSDGPLEPPGPPPGPPGPAGPRGERGLSRLQGRAVVILFLIGALGGAGNLFWTSHTVDVERGQWCSLIITLDQAYTAKPPAPGTTAAQVAAQVHQRRLSLGCPAGATPGSTP